MSKKKKKSRGPKTNIRKITCIDCPMEPNVIVKEEECKACDLNDQGYCKFTEPSTLISVVSQGTPMKFNRTFFKSASRDIGNSTRNYYLPTKIMEDVKFIQGFPNYTRAKARFLEGEFKGKDNGVVSLQKIPGNRLVPVLSFARSNDEPDLLLGGEHYKAAENNGKEEGDFDILYYLYNMYSLDGFADITIQGKQYKVKLSPVEGSKEDLVLVKQGDKLIIGSIRK